MPAGNQSALRENLNYEPRELKFGTSGRRGDVVDLTQLEIYINATAELEYLQSFPRSEGGIVPGEDFYLAYDLRPSSNRFVPSQQARGEIAQAIAMAIRDANMNPVNLGCIPTPALANYALRRNRGSIMITGSHIPFERNGYKTNTSKGELLKKDEAPIQACVAAVRDRLYRQPFADSPFDAGGMLKCGHLELAPESGLGAEDYIRRYAAFYKEDALNGLRLLVYQHSAVGRDLLVEILERLGAEVIPAGRSETFVPIDTENIDEEQLGKIQALAAEVWDSRGSFDGIVSTDGDSDRPLILGVEPAHPCKVRFHSGDLVGMIVAEHLGADAVVVPITCNDAIDRGPLQSVLEPKTRIGSPYVIAGMEQARQKGRIAICGWEANGGFLTGSDFTRDGRVLPALPTRDALLPILGALTEAASRKAAISSLFGQLPCRFGRAALLKDFPRAVSETILSRLSPRIEDIRDVVFTGQETIARNAFGEQVDVAELAPQMESIREIAARFFTSELGFPRVSRINYTDGARFSFENGDVAHIRPSGNADELRIYAVADSQQRADEIAGHGVAEPSGILRRLAADTGENF
jgi:phosphomannomutase